ncbi:MAG: FMN-binding protein [Lentisphaeria bacterium]|nr:FMN-binding protein [Lentisphaeria bacterium]
MRMTILLIALVAGGVLRAVPELPEKLKPFGRDLAAAMPRAAVVKAAGAGIFDILDAKGDRIGRLYSERISDDERKPGYGGPVEIAVVLNKDGKISGVLIGKNQETPAFLKRVRARKFLDSWNGIALTEVASRKVDSVTGATYSSEAVKHGVRKLAESYTGSSGSSPASPSENERTAMEEELRGLIRKAAMHRRIISAGEKLISQMENRRDEDLKLRFIAAVEGRDAAARFAAEKGLVFFVHPSRGPRKAAESEILAARYGKSRSQTDLAALRTAIAEEQARLLAVLPPHNLEHEKGLKSAEARIRILRKKLSAK